MALQPSCFFILGGSGLQLELDELSVLRDGSRSQKRASMNFFTASRGVCQKVGLNFRTLVVASASCANGWTLCLGAREETGPSRRTFTPMSERCSTFVDKHLCITIRLRENNMVCPRYIGLVFFAWQAEW